LRGRTNRNHTQTINVYTNNHADPALAALLIALLLLALGSMWLFCLWQWALAKKSAAAAKVDFERQSALRDGARFVSGKVELGEGESVAVRVTITQHGSEIRGKSPTHKWTETERRVEKRPFYLRLDSGERVRVDAANAAVLLVDKLDRMHWVQKWERQKRAQLDAGERAFAKGILRRRHDPNAAGVGYRDAGESWVLMPLAGRIHVSTEDVAQRHQLRARVCVGDAAVAAVGDGRALAGVPVLRAGEGRARRAGRLSRALSLHDAHEQRRDRASLGGPLLGRARVRIGGGRRERLRSGSS
jgi:hypothetical protein